MEAIPEDHTLEVPNAVAKEKETPIGATPKAQEKPKEKTQRAKEEEKIKGDPAGEGSHANAAESGGATISQGPEQQQREQDRISGTYVQAPQDYGWGEYQSD